MIIQFNKETGIYLCTIPIDVVRKLGLKKGDDIEFSFIDNESFKIQKSVIKC